MVRDMYTGQLSNCIVPVLNREHAHCATSWLVVCANKCAMQCTNRVVGEDVSVAAEPATSMTHSALNACPNVEANVTNTPSLPSSCEAPVMVSLTHCAPLLEYANVLGSVSPVICRRNVSVPAGVPETVICSQVHNVSRCRDVTRGWNSLEDLPQKWCSLACP